MNQYEWLRTEDGAIDYCYSEFELLRRRTYLEKVDQYAQATAQDIKESLVGGRQVLCWGAGSGKTTAIRQFICEKFVDGIVYATFTKEEATKMAYDVASFIGHSRVLLLHTDSYKMIGDEEISMSEYINQNPRLIQEYPVVITTHRRLLIDPPHLYTAVLNRSKSHKSPMRGYIFIDEKPNVYDKIAVQNSVRDLISLATAGETNPDFAVEKFENMLRSDNAKILKSASNLIWYLTGTSPEKEIAKDRAMHILYTIFELESTESDLVINNDDGEFYVYYYHLGLLDVPNLVIFDGTGDCLFRDSQDWNIIHNNKFNYKFRGSIEQLDLYLPRNINELDSGSLFEWVEKLHEVIGNVLLMNERVLIVTWKSLHGQLSLLETNDDIPMSINTQVQPETEFSDYVTKLLMKNGIARDQFDVTYYQSGKTRATSEFSDCDAIIFLGAFQLPNYVIHEYNKVNRSKITGTDYLLAEVVQSIYRTRIRKGQAVNVYLSSDFNPGFMSSLHEYLSINTSKYFQYKLTSSVPMDPRNIFANALMENAEEFLREGKIQVSMKDLTQVSRRSNVLRSFERFNVNGVKAELEDDIITLTLETPVTISAEILDD